MILIILVYVYFVKKPLTIIERADIQCNTIQIGIILLIYSVFIN
jgi:hypothetical protein